MFLNRGVDPMIAVARPKGLGLGADKALAQQSLPSAGQSSDKEERLVMKKGSFCCVTSGKHVDSYGIVSL